MKHFYRLNIIILLLFFSITQTSADHKTAFIDVNYLIENSNVGKKVLNNINELNKKNIDQLKKKNQSLRELESTIKNKKKIMSEEEYNNEVKLFRQNVKNFTDEKDLIVKEFNNYRKQELEKILKLFNPIINEYMTKNSVNILIDSKYVFMANTNSNITETILKMINDKLK
jgi:outer membrane protein